MMSFRKFIRARDWERVQKNGMDAGFFEKYGYDSNTKSFKEHMSGKFDNKNLK